MNTIRCRRCKHTSKDCRFTRWKLKWGNDHQPTDYICEHHFEPKFIMPKGQYYRGSFLTMDAMPNEQNGRPPRAAAAVVIPPATAVTAPAATSNVTGDPGRPSSATIKLTTHEIKFADQSITARCDRIELMTHGLFITQMPLEVDEGDQAKCVFISYREITKMQLSKSPTLDSNYMFITVAPRIAQSLFEKFIVHGTFHLGKCCS